MVAAAQISPFAGIATLGQRLVVDSPDAVAPRPSQVQALERFGRVSVQPQSAAPSLSSGPASADTPQPEGVARAYRPQRDRGRDETAAPPWVRGVAASTPEPGPETSALAANFAYRRRMAASRGLDRPAGRLVNLNI